jgi:hypothetical protein
MCYGKGSNYYIDITNNKTLYNKDVPDGVYCITTGMFANYSDPLCLTGGNCSIQVRKVFDIRDLILMAKRSFGQYRVVILSVSL